MRIYIRTKTNISNINGITLLTRVLDSVRPQSAIRFATNARHRCRSEEAISPAKTGCYSPLKVVRHTESLSLSLSLSHSEITNWKINSVPRLSGAAGTYRARLSPAVENSPHSPCAITRFRSIGTLAGHKAHQFSFLVCEKFPRPLRHKSSRIDSAQMWIRLNVVENFIGPHTMYLD